MQVTRGGVWRGEEHRAGHAPWHAMLATRVTDFTDAPASADQDVSVLVNIGPAIRRRLERIGITEVGHLTGRDPFELYEQMCEADQHRHDPCLLDTLMSAVDQATGGPAKPWWHYTPERKRRVAPSPAPGGHK